MMYSSTSSAYGMNNSPNVETQPDDCLNHILLKYVVKNFATCTLNCMVYQQSHLNVFNVYGERQPLKVSMHLYWVFLRQRAAGQALTIVGDGNQRRDFTYVGDVHETNILAATTEVDFEAFGQVYNVGTGNNYSVVKLLV